MEERKRQLTVKERKLIKGIAKGKTHQQAAKDAGYAGHGMGLAVNTHKVLKRPNVQEALQKELARQGVTLEKIVQPITDALGASKIVTSPTEPDKEVPDHTVRLKASQMAQSLIGVKQEGSTVNVNFIQVAKGDKDEFDI